MRRIVITFLVAQAAALLGPVVRSSAHARRSCAFLSASPAAHTLLRKCDHSADRLATLLSKDDLKRECAARNLPVSGTKATLAPRLLAALHKEAVPAPRNACLSSQAALLGKSE